LRINRSPAGRVSPTKTDAICFAPFERDSIRTSQRLSALVRASVTRALPLKFCQLRNHVLARSLFPCTLRSMPIAPIITNAPTRRDPTNTLASRTHGLFLLLTATCDGSARTASHRIGRDPRSAANLRDVPTLGYIADLGRALGMSSSAALDVITHDAQMPHSLEVLRDSVAVADIDDDAVKLESVAAALARLDDAPHNFTFSLLVLARAASSRGESVRAHEHLQRAKALGLAPNDPLVTRLASTVEHEFALGTPWICASKQVLLGCLTTTSVSPWAGLSCAESMRAHCHALGVRVSTIYAPIVNRYNGNVVLETLALLQQSIDDALRTAGSRDGDRSTIWAASIAGHTAHRVLERHSTDRAIESAALALAVRAAFILEEMAENKASDAHQLACTRRARLVLSEWTSRGARDELPHGSVDEVDLAELHAACVRFPAARDAELLLVIDQLADRRRNIHFRHFPLDTSSVGIQMPSLVPGSRGGVALANDRSESRC